jgi:hypothetical protein
MWRYVPIFFDQSLILMFAVGFFAIADFRHGCKKAGQVSLPGLMIDGMCGDQ